MEVDGDTCAECEEHQPRHDRPQQTAQGERSTELASPRIPTDPVSPAPGQGVGTGIVDKDTGDLSGLPNAELNVKHHPKSVRIDADSASEVSERAVRNIDVSIRRRPYEPSEATSFAPLDEDLSMTGMRGKTNTPTSLYTDFSEFQPKSTLDGLGRVYGAGPGSHEAAYHRALTLMSERCLSRGQPIRHHHHHHQRGLTGPGPVHLMPGGQGDRTRTPLVCIKPRPFGEYKSKFFFVNQRKPVPMPPLKAWRGYHGNVYFEPIEVKSAIMDGDALEGQLTTATAISCLASRNQPGPDPTAATDLPSLPAEGRRSKAASGVRPLTGSSSPTSTIGRGPRPMAVLDKRQVLRSHNEFLREDLRWIQGQESTGSLCISPDSEARRRELLSKERICKGSMAHRVYMQRQVTCSSSAPLLRSGPKRTVRRHRLLNPPQLSANEKLPPLTPL